MKTLDFICRTALPLPLLLCVPGGACAQVAAAPASSEQIAFSADQLSYDDAADLVTASGAVEMNREGHELRADTVTWSRVSGEVRAIGNVRITTPQGDVAYGDSVVLTDTLRDGVVENLLLVLEDGGRLAAQRATRINGTTILDRAAYSPCAVLDEKGCPKDPTWQINALRVVHDPVRKRITYKGASLNLLGMPIVALPGLSHPDGSESGGSGLLVPEVRFSRNNGGEIALPYYWRIADNRDLTITPHVYTEVLPALEAQYRQLTSLGAFQVSGFVTYGSRVSLDSTGAAIPDRNRSLRGYVDANGRFQLTPAWSITGSGRYVTDRTFLRRYDISQEDRLRSMLDIERVTRNSYVSVAGWAFQGLRPNDVGRPQPIALPALDARWRLADPFWDGKIELQANGLMILRTDGQDSQRAFIGARWDRRSITSLGQELMLTAYARGDLYHTANIDPADPAIYRGERGFKSRGIAALAADLRWPFIGNFLGGTQRVTPRVQIVGSPPTRNLSIPNEDARSVDLEDSNLFALNRFPGYDRWEDSSRITYGADWALDLPRIAIRTNIGQSYRLNRRPSILPEGTGLSDRFSDYVGRTTVKFGRKLSLVHRFRLDKDSFAVRRNEIDAAVGGRKTYAEVGYLRLNRDIPATLEDLRDREEIRLGGRLQFARFWSLFGSTVIDLTDAREDVASSADGYEPVRHRLGVTYADDCLEIGVTWRRDYQTTGDFKGGNTFMFRVALKNLGR